MTAQILFCLFRTVSSRHICSALICAAVFIQFKGFCNGKPCQYIQPSGSAVHGCRAVSSRVINFMCDGQSIHWFLGFVISLTLVFVPRIFKYRCLVKARYRSFHRFMEMYEKNLYSHPYLKTSRKFCGQKQAYFQNQLWQTLSEACTFLDDAGFSCRIFLLCTHYCSRSFSFQKADQIQKH